mmetsp:Transcript_12744/g.25708  ORF Transcript_12744/g.25708 Transcript_12744/m.25708 type:complete len:212 (+) Transcript_12744:1853-2488(+)
MAGVAKVVIRGEVEHLAAVDDGRVARDAVVHREKGVAYTRGEHAFLRRNELLDLLELSRLPELLTKSLERRCAIGRRADDRRLIGLGCRRGGGALGPPLLAATKRAQSLSERPRCGRLEVFVHEAVYERERFLSASDALTNCHDEFAPRDRVHAHLEERGVHPEGGVDGCLCDLKDSDEPLVEAQRCEARALRGPCTFHRCGDLRHRGRRR